jgi:hypothetical protein
MQRDRDGVSRCRGRLRHLRVIRDGRTDLFVTGVYVDRIPDESGGLRFAERIVVCDGAYFDTLIAISPNIDLLQEFPPFGEVEQKEYESIGVASIGGRLDHAERGLPVQPNAA